MILYISISYFLMVIVASIIILIDPRNITWKDWVIWGFAPITAPVFILFFIIYKSKQHNNENNHSNKQGDSDQLSGYG